MANFLFPLLYLLFSILLIPGPSLSISISPPRINATYGFVSRSFPSFEPSLANITLTLLGSSISFNAALQITPDLQRADLLIDKSGRIFLTSPCTFWENTNSDVRLASFSTAFDMNIIGTTLSQSGEGIAFIIASSLGAPPPGSQNGYLGLTNYSRNGNPSNKFVAIEFDTVKQSYDIDDNHVGLDVNRVNSTVANSLTPFGMQIAPINGTNYTVWIDYNGLTRFISVYMDYHGKTKPTKTVLNASLDLSKVINKVSYIGFSASTGTRFELNYVLAWEFILERLSEEKTRLSKIAIALIIGLSCSISVVLALILLAFYIKRKQVRDDLALLAGTLRSLPGMPREFDFKELKKATNNFDEKMKLGQGGFGVVYKGVLVGNNGEDMTVAVKQFSRASTKGQDDFLQELSIINRLRHKHLVHLVATSSLCWFVCYLIGTSHLLYDREIWRYSEI